MPVTHNKTVCPVSREAFREKAKKITVTIDGKSFEVDPKDFSTGSIGWNLNDKMFIEIDGKRCQCQVGMNVTLIGSKELPQ